MKGERQLAPVIELRPGVEDINGVRVMLGKMSMEQLAEIEGHCKQRIMDAQTDLWLVQHYVELATPPDGSVA